MAVSTLFLRLFSLCALVLALIDLALVSERTVAALLKAYKFDFDGVSPIILNRETVLEFFVVTALFLVICLFGFFASKGRDIGAAKFFFVSGAFNVTSLVIVVLLLVSSLARI